MKVYTYRVVCFVNVVTEHEENAIELAEDLFPVEPYEIELYEVGEVERDWDSIVDERRLS